MPDGRQRVRNQVLGPRALAVISCALALLAAQPVGKAGEFRVQSSPFSVKSGEFGAAKTETASAGAVGEYVAGARGKAREAGISPARRVHVLATVEMLRRWLAIELRPMQGQVVPALLLTPVCVLIFDANLSPPHRISQVFERRRFTSSHEQRFAIEQCLLAPPMA
jgi:hypothetical protein